MSFVTGLECSACRRPHDHRSLQNVCAACAKPLLVTYDFDALRDAGADFHGRTLWRYLPLLPVDDARHIVSLGEGGTPLLPTRRLGEALGLRALFVKDEGANPTGSFKARGMAVAVTRAAELGAKVLAAPSAGNAAGALAAYGARAGIEVHVAMPRDVPDVNRLECEAFGAHVELVDGLISDAGRLVAQKAKDAGWFDVATFKEPYRVEGKKTMGFELWEDLDRVPDVVVYPTGGGTGLVGIVKALDELEKMGLIGAERPRMVAVQASGCAPVVKALAEKRDEPTPWPDARTDAAGLRVPSPLAGRLIVDAVRRTGGTGLTVDDDEMRRARRAFAASEGIGACLEGAATLAALHHLVHDGAVDRDETIVLLNTGAAWKSPG